MRQLFYSPTNNEQECLSLQSDFCQSDTKKSYLNFNLHSSYYEGVEYSFICLNVSLFWASLVVHSLRIRLPIQGTRVPSLVREDPTCCGATKPVCHNY